MLYLDIGLYIALIYMPKIWQLYKKKLNIKTLDIALDLAIITGLSSGLHHSKEYLKRIFNEYLDCLCDFLGMLFNFPYNNFKTKRKRNYERERNIEFYITE